jgi:hypothetical protein
MPTKEELSAEEIRDILYTELNTGFSDSPYYIRAVYVEKNYCVYSHWSTGKMYKRTFEITEDGLSAKLGDAQEVISRTTYEVVAGPQFAIEIAQFVKFDDRWFKFTGKIFEAGDYPDKEFHITAEELAAAVTDFKPVPIDLEHRATVLSGKLGTLEKVELDEGGKTLKGEAKIPEWLHKCLEAGKVKVSCTWDKLTKRLIGLALTLNPRVSDAALVAEYAAFVGARHSKADLKDMQDVHDIALRQGAKCETEADMALTEKNKPFLKRIMEWLKSEKIPDDAVAEFAELHAKAPNPPAPSPPTPTPAPSTAPNPPNPAPTTPTPTPTTPPAAPATESAEMTDLRKQVRNERMLRIRSEAKAFVAEQIRASKVLPAQEAQLIEQYVACAEDDEDNPKTVSFNVATEKKTGSRVDAFKAAIEAFPAHKLVKEEVFALVPNGTEQKTESPVPDTRVQELLGKTGFSVSAPAK